MKTILMIEDDPDMLQITSELLELEGYVALKAPSGPIGVAMAREKLPDLVLCDINMSELDGYGVLYELGRDVRTAEIPFIFLSGKAERSDVRKGMELGADDYLTKPFKANELLAAVDGRLKRRTSFRRDLTDGLDGLDRLMDGTRGLETLKDLRKGRKRKRYEEGEVLFREGDALDHLPYIVKGRVRTSKMNKDEKEFNTTSPHDFSLWYLLGKCRQVQAKWHDGDAAFSTCIAMSRNCWLAWRDRGICRLQLQQSQEAASDFRQVVALRPDDPAAFLNLALAQMQAGQLADAEASITTCIEGNGPTRAWFIRSQLRAMRQDSEGAEKDFQNGLAAEPNEVDSWIARGMSILPQDPATALKDFEMALRWYPMSRDAMQNISHVFSERLNRPQDAVQQLDQLLQFYPADNAARFGRGVLLARLGESVRASGDAEQVLQQKPQLCICG